MESLEMLIGEAAWNAYSAAVGGKAFNGDPLPTWAAMRADPKKQHLVKAWLAAAEAVRDELQKHGYEAPMDEERQVYGG